MHALPLYAMAFESVNALDKLENFASRYGAQFYGLAINTTQITLIKQPQTIPESFHYLGNKTLTPLLAGEVYLGKWLVYEQDSQTNQNSHR